MTKPKKSTIKTITWDQWAASGGTAGIFAVAVRRGEIKIKG